MTTAAQVIAQARADLGMREKPPGSNLVPITREFGRIPGYPGGGYGYPWCAAATSIWCRTAGLKPNADYPHTASTIAQYNWAKTNKQWHAAPKAGDLVLYSKGGSAGIYHVELVEKVSASSITTIGGNTSGSDGNGIQGEGDGCYRKTVSLGNHLIYGYVRPRYAGASDAPDEPWDGKSYPGHLIRRGDHGAEVKAVQQLLNTFGAKLAVDADFGPSTEQAVRTFQRSVRLTVDGVVGKDTWKALAAKPKAAPQPATKAPAASPVLKVGDSGPEVKRARDRLISLGYSYLKPGLKWGPLQTVAVMDAQARHRLKVTGQLDAATRKALGL
ncbi:peptidoglycan-binding protein [Streptosporangium sp. NPDC000239]|uniref:peptidoglycan-binding protein n=1 Tax=Streptosporangium sp. NPDC000239 TaxID=3154248 RepID=UPI003325CA5A